MKLYWLPEKLLFLSPKVLLFTWKLCLPSQKQFFLPQIIAAVYGVKESYHNLQVLITFLRLQEQRQSKLVMDLSCANKTSGLQAARAR